MKWSYSASRTFKQCQRQWYFKNIVASGTAKRDQFRKQAYLLSKLQSVSAWRGKIVDDVISNLIVPRLNRKSKITLGEVKTRARELFDRQLAFARTHVATDLELQPSKHGDDFALFYTNHYGPAVTDDEIDRAWAEIEAALENLFGLGAIKDLLKSADYLIAQRSLSFSLMDGVTPAAVPDLIAFRNGEPPIIVDWKVHVFGQNDAWLQLGIYAIALSRCAPHSDFPAGLAIDPLDVELYEAQLLTNIVRRHELDEDRLSDAEDYITASAYEIVCLTEGEKYAGLSIEDFTRATYGESCQRCAFRAICWEGGHHVH
jgi:hypothetical protein